MAEENNWWNRKIIGSSAWLSSTSDRRLININLGTQGDVVTGVDGNFIKGVGGSVIKGVHGGVTYGEKNIRLPRFVALKAKYNGKCLRLTKNDGALPVGFLKFEGREVASPEAKFELEKAQTGYGLVHIRCCHNNKYLVRSGVSHWIVAAADKPEENESKISCTLFEPEPAVNKSGGLEFRVRHVQLGTYACLWTAELPFDRGFYGASSTPDKDEYNVYTVLDWESQGKKMNKAKGVVLPRLVGLKAIYNNKYLSVTKKDLPAGFLKFYGVESENTLTEFQVKMAKSGNGLVHIRCCHNNKYLVRDGNKHWIVATADKPQEDEFENSCTLFEPEPYDESGRQEFRFRHVQLGMYACLWRGDTPFYGGLYVGSNAPSKDACDVFTVVNLEDIKYVNLRRHYYRFVSDDIEFLYDY